MLTITDKDGTPIATVEKEKLPLTVKHMNKGKIKIYHIKETRNEGLILN